MQYMHGGCMFEAPQASTSSTKTTERNSLLKKSCGVPVASMRRQSCRKEWRFDAVGAGGPSSRLMRSERLRAGRRSCSRASKSSLLRPYTLTGCGASASV